MAVHEGVGVDGNDDGSLDPASLDWIVEGPAFTAICLVNHQQLLVVAGILRCQPVEDCAGSIGGTVVHDHQLECKGVLPLEYSANRPLDHFFFFEGGDEHRDQLGMPPGPLPLTAALPPVADRSQDYRARGQAGSHRCAPPEQPRS